MLIVGVNLWGGSYDHSSVDQAASKLSHGHGLRPAATAVRAGPPRLLREISGRSRKKYADRLRARTTPGGLHLRGLYSGWESLALASEGSGVVGARSADHNCGFDGTAGDDLDTDLPFAEVAPD